MHKVVLYVTLVINVFTLFAMIGAILLHSGQGGGLSDMFGGASSASFGSTSAERNLNRITTVLAAIWVLTVIALGLLLAQ